MAGGNREATVKKISYSCDICRDSMPSTDLIGFEFGGADRLKFGPQHQTVRHICEPCLEAMGRLATAWRDRP